MTYDPAYVSRYYDEYGEREWARLEAFETWRALLAWEEDFCREPGALDGGTHIIVVARKTAPDSGHEGWARQRAEDVGTSL